ncbi:thermonuclease family protein [Synechococcus sp. PCC 7336]|uniref:thermonuclease family protein n=1 Tax=Synechococcus sp. PCC 7336 TaxID=195250 RepID=UPI00037D5D35|nr:thermonuclease family protein [Synechococcus sp. PCC 7336]
MLKQCVLASIAVGFLHPAIARAYGEPRIVPDHSFYFSNDNLDRHPQATVVKVLSGTTVLVQVEGELELREIQLAGLENLAALAPSIEQEAIGRIEGALLHRIVRLEGDTFQRTPEGTGAVQAYVWLNGLQMNEELVRAGLAVVDRTNHNIKHDNFLRGVQSEARADQIGIWSPNAELATEAQIWEE